MNQQDATAKLLSSLVQFNFFSDGCTYIVDQEGKVGLLAAFILTHVLLSVAVEFGGLALLVRVVLLFVDEHGLARLR